MKKFGIRARIRKKETEIPLEEIALFLLFQLPLNQTGREVFPLRAYLILTPIGKIAFNQIRIGILEPHGSGSLINTTHPEARFRMGLIIAILLQAFADN
jgi:hypothetical protein